MTSYVQNISIKVQKDSIEIEDGHVFSESLLKIREYKNNRKFCDVVICTPNQDLVNMGNNEESFSELYGHSCIIASCSSFISSILINEEISMKQQKKIVFQDIEFDIMKACLDFMYGMKVKVHCSKLNKLKAAAEMLKINSLVTHCKVSISIVSKNNVKQLQPMSNKTFPSEDLKEYQEDKSNISRLVKETIPTVPIQLQNIDTKTEPSVNSLFKVESNSNELERKTESKDVTKDGYMEFMKLEILKTTEELTSDNNNDDNLIEENSHERCNSFDVTATKSTNNIEMNHAKSKTKVQKYINNKSKRVKKYANLKEKNRALTEMGRKPRPCNHCGVMYKNYRALRKHMKEVNGDVLTCQYCSKTFVSKSSLTCHEKRHKEEKNYKCEICEFRAVTKVEVEWHMSSHNNLPGAICDLCGKSFKRKRTLKIHMIQVHGESAQLYECPSCSYTHPSLGVLKYHMIRHQKQGTEVCTVCGKIYKRKHSLKEHMKVAHSSVIYNQGDTNHLFIATEVVEEDTTAILSQDDSSNHIYSAAEYQTTEAQYQDEEEESKDVDQQLITAARNCDDMSLAVESAGQSQNISEYGHSDSMDETWMKK